MGFSAPIDSLNGQCRFLWMSSDNGSQECWNMHFSSSTLVGIANCPHWHKYLGLIFGSIKKFQFTDFDVTPLAQISSSHMNQNQRVKFGKIPWIYKSQREGGMALGDPGRQPHGNQLERNWETACEEWGRI